MAHGGTTFGLWGGCDRPFRPDTTSYDYDAPIGEAGWIGEKFDAYRAAITPFLAQGETLPAPPPRMPVMTVAPFALAESVSVASSLPAKAIRDTAPRPIEQYDISRGHAA
jgi:beta-galactosidase